MLLTERLALLVLLLLSMGSSGLCLGGVKNMTCESEPINIPCVAFTYDDVTNCTTEKIQDDFPQLYNATNCPARQSRSKDLTAQEMRDGGEFFIYAQSTEFETYEEKGICVTRGFELLYTADDNVQRCVIVQIGSDNPDGYRDSDIIFKVKLWQEQPIKPSLWSLQLSNLPKAQIPASNTSVDTDVLTEFGYVPGKEYSAEWSPIIYHYNDSKTREVSLRISPPPKKYNITYFVITLRKYEAHNRFTYAQKMVVDKFQHTFYEVKPGKYEIMVQPYDDLDRQSSCRCRKSTCKSCSKVYTPAFYIYEYKDIHDAENITMESDADAIFGSKVTLPTFTPMPKENTSTKDFRHITNSENISKMPITLKITTTHKLETTQSVTEEMVLSSAKGKSNEDGEISKRQTFLLVIIMAAVAIIGLLAILVCALFCFQRRRNGTSDTGKQDTSTQKFCNASKEKNAVLDANPTNPNVFKTLLVLHDDSCSEITLHLTSIFRRNYEFTILNLNHFILPRTRDSFGNEVESAVQSADFVLLIGLPSTIHLTYLDYCYERTFHMVLSMISERSILPCKTALVCFGEKRRNEALVRSVQFNKFQLMKDFGSLQNFLLGTITPEVKSDLDPRESECLKESIIRYRQNENDAPNGLFLSADIGIYSISTDDDGAFSVALTIGEGQLEPPAYEETEVNCYGKRQEDDNNDKNQQKIGSTRVAEKYGTTDARYDFRCPDPSLCSSDVTSDVLMNQMEEINKESFLETTRNEIDISSGGISV